MRKIVTRRLGPLQLDGTPESRAEQEKEVIGRMFDLRPDATEKETQAVIMQGKGEGMWFVGENGELIPPELS